MKQNTLVKTEYISLSYIKNIKVSTINVGRAIIKETDSYTFLGHISIYFKQHAKYICRSYLNS